MFYNTTEGEAAQQDRAGEDEDEEGVTSIGWVGITTSVRAIEQYSRRYLT